MFVMADGASGLDLRPFIHTPSANGQGYDVPLLIAEADEEGNGAINLQEFCNHMRKRYNNGLVLY